MEVLRKQRPGVFRLSCVGDLQRFGQQWIALLVAVSGSGDPDRGRVVIAEAAPQRPAVIMGDGTSLTYGELDATAPPAFGRWWQHHLADADLEVVGGGGHLVALDRWAQILGALARPA